MNNLQIFTQQHAPHTGYFVKGFDSAVNTGDCAIGHVSGAWGTLPAAVHENATEADQWHVVNLKKPDGRFDSVAILGAVNTNNAADMAMAQFGRFQGTTVTDVLPTSTGGLQRYLSEPAFADKYPVKAWKLDQLQDVLTGQPVKWNDATLSSHNGQVSALLYDMLQHDDNNALLQKFDGLDVLLSSMGVEQPDFDSIVTTMQQLEKLVNTLHDSMNRAAKGGDLTVTSAEISKPFKRNGVAQIAVSYPLSDGQAVTILFHNPDTTPAKLQATDTLISWKIMLNNRDVSGAVHPDQGQVVDAKAAFAYMNKLASRIMQVAQKNSARFVRTQAKRAETAQVLTEAQQRVMEKQDRVDALQAEIADLNKQIEGLGQSAQRQKIIVKPLSSIGIEDNSLAQQAKSLIEVDINKTQKAIASAKRKFAKADSLSEKVNYQNQINKLLATLKEQRFNVFNAEDAIDAYFNDGRAFDDENVIRLFPRVKGLIDSSVEAFYNEHNISGMGSSEETDYQKKVVSDWISLAADTAEGRKLAKEYADYMNKIINKTLIINKQNYQQVGIELQKISDFGYSDTEIMRNAMKVYKEFGEQTLGQMKMVEPEDLPQYGEVEITSIGDENIYFTKDGQQYYSKVGDTENYTLGAFNFQKPMPIVLTGKELGEFPDTPEGKEKLREKAAQFLMSERGKHEYCPALKHDVDIEREGVNKITSFSADIRKLQIVTAIRQLISQCSLVKTTDPYDKNELKKGVVAYHVMKSKVELDSIPLYVRFVIKQKKNGHFEYDYTVDEKENIFDSAQIENASQLGEAFGATNYKSADQLESLLLASSQPDVPTHMTIKSPAENLVNAFDAANGEKYVLNLFVFDQDGNEIWADDEQEQPIVLTGKELGDFPDTPEGKEQLREAAYKKLVNLFESKTSVFCPAVNADVYFNMSGAKKFKRLSGDPRKIKLIAAIESIIESGKLVKKDVPSYEPKEQELGITYDVLKAEVMLEGQTIGARVVLRKLPDNKFQYDLQVMEHVDDIFDSVEMKNEQVRSANESDVLVHMAIKSSPTKTVNAFMADIQKAQTPSYDGVWSATASGDRGVADEPLNRSVSRVASVDIISPDQHEFVNAFDAAGSEKYVLNLFVYDQDGNEIWTDEDEQLIVLTGKELGDFPDTPEGKKQLREAAVSALTALKGTWVDCPALNGLEGDNVKVEIRQRGINEFKAFSGDPRKLKLAAKIEAIIRTAKMPKAGAWQDNQKKSSKRSVAGYYHLTNAVNIDGEKLNITVLIEKDNNGLLHYDLILPKNNAKFDSLEIKMSGRPIPDNYSGGDPDLLITPYDENIVNGFDAANGEKYVLNLFVFDQDGNEIWTDDGQGDEQEQPADQPAPAPATQHTDYTELLSLISDALDKGNARRDAIKKQIAKMIGEFDKQDRYWVKPEYKTESLEATRTPSAKWNLSYYKHVMTDKYLKQLYEKLQSETSQPTPAEPMMNEPQNQSHPDYSQDDIDYLNSIINGDIDPLDADMDRIIAIGEKNETDPVFVRALDLINAAEDAATAGV